MFLDRIQPLLDVDVARVCMCGEFAAKYMYELGLTLDIQLVVWSAGWRKEGLSCPAICIHNTMNTYVVAFCEF